MRPNPNRVRWIKRARINMTPRRFLPRLSEIFLTPPNEVMFPTATPKAILRFGKPFIETFPKKQISPELSVTLGAGTSESPISIKIEKEMLDPKDNEFGHSAIVEARIGFERKALIVEAIQGVKNRKKEIRELWKHIHVPWPNYLLEQIEEHARACGLKQVKIRKPATLYYYKKPAVENRDNIPAIRKRMEEMYRKAAAARGYQAEGAFYIKKI